MTDSLSKRGAAFMAAQLDAWWHATGALHVRHWIEPNGTDRTSAGATSKGSDGDDDGHTVWAVRSNLVRGNPPPPELT
jgi:hypothetical protein